MLVIESLVQNKDPKKIYRAKIKEDFQALFFNATIYLFLIRKPSLKAFPITSPNTL